jgi:hypothetical protein
MCVQVEVLPCFVISNTYGTNKHIEASRPNEVTQSRRFDLYSEWKRDWTKSGRDDAT